MAGTLSNFFARINAPVAAPASFTVTVQRNGDLTGLSCVIQAPFLGGSSCLDTVNSVAFAAGDRISIGIASAGGPGARQMSFTARFAQQP